MKWELPSDYHASVVDIWGMRSESNFWCRKNSDRKVIKRSGRNEYTGSCYQTIKESQRVVIFLSTKISGTCRMRDCLCCPVSILHSILSQSLTCAVFEPICPDRSDSFILVYLSLVFMNFATANDACYFCLRSWLCCKEEQVPCIQLLASISQDSVAIAFIFFVLLWVWRCTFSSEYAHAGHAFL